MDDGSSSASDYESLSDENSSPTCKLHEEHSDSGEFIDLNEDTDLNSQDLCCLLNIFESKVCLKFQLAQPLKLMFSL